MHSPYQSRWRVVAAPAAHLVLEIAAIPRHAGQVHTGAQHHIGSLRGEQRQVERGAGGVRKRKHSCGRAGGVSPCQLAGHPRTLRYCSLPMAAPHVAISAGSHDITTVRAAGQHVTFWLPFATPWGPSCSWIAGITVPSLRTTAGVSPTGGGNERERERRENVRCGFGGQHSFAESARQADAGERGR